jgi:hypothetical protein
MRDRNIRKRRLEVLTIRVTHLIEDLMDDTQVWPRRIVRLVDFFEQSHECLLVRGVAYRVRNRPVVRTRG